MNKLTFFTQAALLLAPLAALHAEVPMHRDTLVPKGALLPTTSGYAKGPTEAFLMAYFVGDSVEENRLHLCWSLDGLKWTALNNDKPVVTSSMSTKAIRDPAILRKQDGAFVLMYTDAAWSVGQKPTCGFWDSPDLVNWTNQRICTLSGNPAVPAWGPEAIYDPASGNYIVLWSTSTSDSLWYNTTTDFNTFSPEARFFSPGHQVLENNILQHGEYYYLIYKDERGHNSANTPYKALKVARSKSLTPGSFTTLTEDYISPHLSEGPVICKAINADRWYLYYDMFMEGGIFKCATTTNLNGNTTDWSPLPDNQFSLPKRVRNGHILEIDREELIRLRDVWDNGPNFAGGCTAVVSSAMVGNPASQANDLSYNTFWSAAAGKGANEWLEINLGTSRTFNKTILRQSNSDRITGYKIQYHNGTEWLDAYTGGSMGNKVKIDTFPAVTSSRVRLLVTQVQPGAAVAESETDTCPQINEFDIYLNTRKVTDEASPGATPVSTAITEKIDWPAFMARHDMMFETLPRSWQEAPHFGNAMVGSMLYRSNDTIRLQVFRADVQDHRDDTWGWPAYSRPRLRIGHFSLHTVGKLTGCTWRKDLWNAELSGTIATDRGAIKIRHFTHAADMAVVTELTPDEGEKGFSWTWHPEEAITSRQGYPTNAASITAFAKHYGQHYEKTLKLWQPNPAGRLVEAGGISVWIQDLLSGGQYATGWGEVIQGDTRIHIVSMANSYPEPSAAVAVRSDLSRFMKCDRAEWINLHQGWWHDYYRKSFVSIPDKGLEALYWQTIYRLGCTTRAGRCFVDTPGIWFQGGSWPYFTTDWNIQSAHWPVYAANRLEQGEELVNRLHAGREELIKAVRPVEWQSDSAYLPIEVALDMIGNREQDKRYYDVVGLLPWTLHNAWSQYRFSMDEAMLRDRIYPLLRRAVNFYLRLASEGADGKLHLPPTYSPESGVWKDCSFDLALFKWGCLTLLKAIKRLGIDDPLAPKWRDAIARLPDFPVCDEGFKQGSDRPLLKHHRHQSHLLMIYPLYLVNIDQEGSRDVLRRSVRQAYELKGSDSLPAMVQAHAGPIASALGDGDLALEGLKRQQADLLPNGLWATLGNPCIEATLSVANNIQDMLIQSWSDPAKAEPGPIRVFPAVPTDWLDVEFHDLRAEGAFLVSARRAAGKTQWVRVKSLAGEPCRIKTDLTGDVKIQGCRMIALGDGLFELKLLKGGEALLYCGEAPPSAVVAPLSIDPAKAYHFGMQKQP